MVDTKGWLTDQSVSTGMIVSGKTKIPIASTQYPADEAAERALLGAILLIGQSATGDTAFALSQIANITFEDFFYRRHGIIYLAMLAINRMGGKIDTQSLRTQLANAKTNGIDFLSQIGGDDYLLTLMTSAKGLNIKTYAQQIMLISLRRTLLFNSQRQASLYSDTSRSLSDLILEGQNAARDVTRRLMNMSKQTSFILEDVVQQRIDLVKQEALDPNFVPGITSGIQDLDDGILYFQKGRGYVFAAPSGWGKTIAMMNFAIAAAKAGHRVLYITLEMSAAEFTDRAICAIAHINYEHYQTRELTDKELERLTGAHTTVLTLLGDKMITIVEMTFPTLDEIESKMADHAIDPGYELAIVDYLKADKVNVDGDERNATIHIFQRWDVWKKDMFKHAAHITATQINRGDTGSREDYNMDRLYGSTIIQNVADLVIFIYREDKASKEQYVEPHIYLEFLIEKGRNVKFRGDIKAILDDETLALRNRFEPMGEP